jgi:putative transposase
MTQPARKRMKRYELPGGIRYITFSCEDCLPLMGSPKLRDIFSRSLVEARQRVPVHLFAWVAMPEHAHLLLRPFENVPLAKFLKSFKVSTSQRFLASLRRQRSPLVQRIIQPDGRPRVWLPGGGFDRNVRGLDEFMREVRYIHRNPVERELVQHPEQWEWSSVRWWMGHREGEIECDPPPGNPRAWEQWLGYM